MEVPENSLKGVYPLCRPEVLIVLFDRLTDVAQPVGRDDKRQVAVIHGASLPRLGVCAGERPEDFLKSA